MRSHSTKNQLKEKSPEANFIRSNTWWALLLFIVQKIQFSVSSSVRQFQSRGHSALGTFLAASSSCPKLHTRAWSLPGVGSALARPRRRLLRRRDLPWRPTGGTHGRTPFSAAQSPLALRVSLPCQRTPVAPSPWPGKHGTCSLPPTGRATPVPSSSPSAPSPSPV